jgi:uncharacterized membrane protein YeaQ/YmgE (transglycosylase-associated protein family)
MGIIGYIVSLVVVGLVIGALGRLVVPGPNPIGIGMTIVIGVVGAILGALIGGLIGLGALSILLEVALSGGLVYLASGNGRKWQLTRRTW